MTIKAKLLALGVLLALFGVTFYASYLKGWYAHSDKVNSEHTAKNKKAEKAVATGEQKAAAASAEGKVIYRTIYRDWIGPYISIHFLSLNPLLVRRRRYSRGERYPSALCGCHSL